MNECHHGGVRMCSVKGQCSTGSPLNYVEAIVTVHVIIITIENSNNNKLLTSIKLIA